MVLAKTIKRKVDDLVFWVQENLLCKLHSNIKLYKKFAMEYQFNIVEDLSACGNSRNRHYTCTRVKNLANKLILYFYRHQSLSHATNTLSRIWQEGSVSLKHATLLPVF